MRSSILLKSIHTFIGFSSFSDAKRCKSFHNIQINFGRIAPANLVTTLSGLYIISASHTDTLETNNDADPAEATYAELSASYNLFDTAELSKTKVADTQEPTVTARQTAEVAAPSSESVENIIQNADADADAQTTLPASMTKPEADNSPLIIGTSPYG